MFEFLSFNKRRKAKEELTNTELNELMKRISEGKDFRKIEADFSRLYEATVYRMWELLSTKYIPPLTHDDVRDVFQEAWIKILNWRERYNPKHNAFSWIYVIKKNMLIDRLRQVNRTYTKRVDDDERDIIEELPESDTSFFDEMVSSETVQIILDAIKGIDDERDREIVERRLVHEQKLAEISEDMDIPLATVFKIIKRRIEEIKPKIEYLLNN